jgi:hypothetical protein
MTLWQAWHLADADRSTETQFHETPNAVCTPNNRHPTTKGFRHHKVPRDAPGLSRVVTDRDRQPHVAFKRQLPRSDGRPKLASLEQTMD